MSYKIEDAFQRYIKKECTVYVIGDEYIEGVLREVGDGWVLVADEDSEEEYVISTANIVYISVENED